MLAKHAGLNQDAARRRRVGVDQRHRGAVVGNPIHQSRHPLGYPDPAPHRVEITQVGMQQAAVVDRRRGAQHHLDQALGHHRDEAVVIIADHILGIGIVVLYLVQRLIYAVPGLPQDLLRVVRIAPLDIGEPGVRRAGTALEGGPVGLQFFETLPLRVDLVQPGQVVGALAQVVLVDVVV